MPRWTWIIALVLVLSMTATHRAQANELSAVAVRQESEAAAASVTVLMTEYALGPGEIEATAGTVHLRLVNAGIRRHSLTVLMDGVEHSSPEVRPGDAADWLLQIERPGQYAFWCNEYRHLEKGMGGTLVIR